MVQLIFGPLISTWGPSIYLQVPSYVCGSTSWEPVLLIIFDYEEVQKFKKLLNIYSHKFSKVRKKKISLPPPKSLLLAGRWGSWDLHLLQMPVLVISRIVFFTFYTSPFVCCSWILPVPMASTLWFSSPHLGSTQTLPPTQELYSMSMILVLKAMELLMIPR